MSQLGHWELSIIIDTLLNSDDYQTVLKLMRTSKFMYSIVHPKWTYYLNHLPTITDETVTWTAIGRNKQLLHSSNDKPAIIDARGTQKWYRYGQLHRDHDKPAYIESDGTQKWYQNGQLHRDNDKPAIIYFSGDKYWYQKGQCHLDQDKPAVIWSNGTQYWYQYGQLHRDNDKPTRVYPNCNQ